MTKIATIFNFTTQFVASLSLNCRTFSRYLLLAHLQFSVRVRLSVSERQERLQYHLLGQGAVHLSCAGRAVEGEQQASSHHQSLGEDVGALVERLADAADIVVQEPAVELREEGGRS